MVSETRVTAVENDMRIYKFEYVTKEAEVRKKIRVTCSGIKDSGVKHVIPNENLLGGGYVG